MSFDSGTVMERAVFGGGCFWCVEGAFKQLKGVHSALPGYAGGEDPSPNYESVCRGKTGHAEVVEVMFDAEEISYSTLLEVFFTVHDPTQLNRQGNDIGTQYRSAIYTTSPFQDETAREITKQMQAYWKQPIVTEIAPLSNYHEAEPYHHDYYARNPNQGYCMAVVGPKLRKVRQKHAHLYRQ